MVFSGLIFNSSRFASFVNMFFLCVFCNIQSDDVNLVCQQSRITILACLLARHSRHFCAVIAKLFCALYRMSPPPLKKKMYRFIFLFKK
uniref:Putative secreted protein n=1 Tax=Ixodes ricinus TaxID=34613 RepID=A0A6B0UAA4_IXORI